jgi:hypothetical protein
MIGLLLRRGLQRTEKDHLAPATAQGIANMRRHPALMGDKIAAFAHAVHQIIKRIDTGEQRRQSLRLIKIDGPAGDAGQSEFCSRSIWRAAASTG